MLSGLRVSPRVSSEKVEKVWPILEEMLTLFYPPFRAEDEDELLHQTLLSLRRYVLELSAFDRDTLELAWGRVVADHKPERWPTINAIMEAARGKHEPPSPYKDAKDARQAARERVKALVDSVLFGYLGAQAAREGWCFDLKIFLETNKREPTDAEIRAMQGAYRKSSEVMADFEKRAADGEEILGLKSLRGIFAHMPVREKALAEQILERAAA